MNKLNAIVFLVFCKTSLLFADDSARALMDGVYASFLKVIPYTYSDESGLSLLQKNPSHRENLIKDLTDISDFFKSAKHVEYFQRPGFRPSLDTINQHLVGTISAVKSNNIIFAQKRLKAMSAICISCHSQLSESATANNFGSAVLKAKRESFESDYNYGNYLFLIRHFSESQKYFEAAIEASLQKSAENEELFSSLRRLMSIHTKIEFSQKTANLFIDKYLSDKRLSPIAKSILSTWKSSLKKWDKFDPKKISAIESFIKKELAPLESAKSAAASAGENDITLLVASGVLSKHLNDYPKTKLAPEILYWLSIAERRLSNTYFFSLSDLYLKDCIQLYPKSHYAKKCYKEYAENIEFGYSGSSGTDIPADEKQELERLKKLVK